MLSSTAAKYRLLEPQELVHLTSAAARGEPKPRFVQQFHRGHSRGFKSEAVLCQNLNLSALAM